MTEQLPYKVLRDYGDFELRRYPAYNLVQVQEKADYTQAGYRGFNPLFQFIAGSNSANEKIAMTAPVLQKEVTQGVYAVSFVMPQAMSAERIPAPRDPAVKTVHVEAHDTAVIKFSGLWSESKFDKVCQKLRAAMAREGLSAAGPAYSARYDPPWKPGFLRRNEALIDLV